MEPHQKRQIIRLIVIVITVVALLAGVIWLSARNAGKVRLDIAVFPSDATLNVDGRAEHPGGIWVTRGKHTLRAKRQYFEDATKEIDTAAINLKQTLYLITKPNSDQATAFIQSHPEERDLYELATQSEFSATQESILNRYPIVTKLPHKAIDYSIDYTVDTKKNVTLDITLNLLRDSTQKGYQDEVKLYKKEALDYLKANGVTPNSIPMTFKDSNGKKL